MDPAFSRWYGILGRDKFRSNPLITFMRRIRLGVSTLSISYRCILSREPIHTWERIVSSRISNQVYRHIQSILSSSHTYRSSSFHHYTPANKSHWWTCITETNILHSLWGFLLLPPLISLDRWLHHLQPPIVVRVSLPSYSNWRTLHLLVVI